MKKANVKITTRPGRKRVYDQWMRSIGVPIYQGHHVADLRSVELAWWEDRQAHAAFLHLKGMEGVSEARVMEIPPGKEMAAMKLAVGELVYVLEGQGLTTVWSDKGGPRKTFEWDAKSLFHLPRHLHHQIFNASGEKPARLLHYNYLPVAMSVVPDPDFFFDNPYQGHQKLSDDDEIFAEPEEIKDDREGPPGIGVYWVGNFFPDLSHWDRLNAFADRGAGGYAIFMRFPDAEMGAHMSVFSPGLYKKGHRHGPGRVIVIPAGEGYSVLWKEGGEKIVCPWQEATVFVPPEDWYHQHFNTGSGAARYLALGPMPQFRGKGETLADRADRQIEYPDEDPWIRETFEAELAKRGAKSLMVPEAYQDRDYRWAYADEKD
ncbi:MAG: cupin domain-containing protein [Alphaproteobacteria bacterium]|nr:cupin domain-containing protein [Alphaproteobacteria bacterium]